MSASPDTSAPSDGRGEPIVSEALRERWRRKEEEVDSREDVRETPGGDRGDVGVRALLVAAERVGDSIVRLEDPALHGPAVGLQAQRDARPRGLVGRRAGRLERCVDRLDRAAGLEVLR